MPRPNIRHLGQIWWWRKNLTAIDDYLENSSDLLNIFVEIRDCVRDNECPAFFDRNSDGQTYGRC